MTALTVREREVLHTLAEGLSYDKASSKLEMSINTIRSHVRNIYRKLDVSNLASAIDAMRLIDLLGGVEDES